MNIVIATVVGTIAIPRTMIMMLFILNLTSITVTTSIIVVVICVICACHHCYVYICIYAFVCTLVDLDICLSAWLHMRMRASKCIYIFTYIQYICVHMYI